MAFAWLSIYKFVVFAWHTDAIGRFALSPWWPVAATGRCVTAIVKTWMNLKKVDLKIRNFVFQVEWNFYSHRKRSLFCIRQQCHVSQPWLIVNILWYIHKYLLRDLGLLSRIVDQFWIHIRIERHLALSSIVHVSNTIWLYRSSEIKKENGQHKIMAIKSLKNEFSCSFFKQTYRRFSFTRSHFTSKKKASENVENKIKFISVTYEMSIAYLQGAIKLHLTLS